MPRELMEWKTGKIIDMVPGDHGYTVPWAIKVDESGCAWLDGSYMVEPEYKGGTTSLIVKCTKDGFVVDVGSVPLTQKWSRDLCSIMANFIPITEMYCDRDPCIR